MTEHSTDQIIQTARHTLLLEAESLKQLVPLVQDSFADVVRRILRLKGRVVVTGIGKSAIIAQKIAATLNSTGTPSLFMHAGDAIHGDLGMIQPDDLVLCLSKSGESPEIKVLVPLLRMFSVPIVAIVGNLASTLARQADYVVDASVSGEACPNNLAPTSSTTAQIALGDALAVCLMTMKGFSPEDFARVHPGGTLGKKLFLKVSDLALHNARPAVHPDSPLNEVILEMTEKRLGMTAVLNPDDSLIGIITDGDLRRMLKQHGRLEALKASDIMSPKPKCIDARELAVKALELMRSNNITQLVVLDGARYSGVIHLHDLIREGLI